MSVSREAFFRQLASRAEPLKARILLPEDSDPRVLEAARKLAIHKLGMPLFLSDLEFQSLRESAAEMAPLPLAASLLSQGVVDAVVAGSLTTTADVLRIGIRGVGLAQIGGLVSSAYLMVAEDKVLTFGDCAVNPNPSPDQLAQIAIDCASTHQRLTGEEPHVGLLSFSTRGSAEHDDIDRIKEALSIVQARRPDLSIDGELQFDAAYVPAIAALKAGDSRVAGHCNVFIFPNLSAGNIAYKIAERIGGLSAVGPVIQGLAKPWLDLSRGCSVDDVVHTSLIAALLAAPVYANAAHAPPTPNTEVAG